MAEVEKVLQDAKVDKSQVSQIIMVGGSSRIPAIQKRLTNYFEGRVKLNTQVKEDEVVAIGACLMAAKLKGVPNIDIPTTQDVAPLSVGYAAKNQIDLPWYKRLFCSPQQEIILIPIIKRNTLIACEAAITLETTRNNQGELTLIVMQGESRLAQENCLVGQLVIQNLRPGVAGSVQVDCVYKVNTDGILSVVATERGNPNNSVSLNLNSCRWNLTDNIVEERKAKVQMLRSHWESQSEMKASTEESKRRNQ